MNIMKDVYKSLLHFNKCNASQMAAALSYYSLFALGPILLILFFILELFLSDLHTQTTILNEIYRIFPYDIAFIINNIILHITNYPTPTTLSGFLGIIILIVSSTTIIRELQKDLNIIFEVNYPTKTSVSQRVQNRIIALGFILILGVLILGTFIINTALNAVGQYITVYNGLSPVLLYYLNLIVSLLSVSILFSLLFKYLSDADINWEYIIVGGFITGMLFTIGKNIIAYMLGHANFGTLYGTMGTFLIFIIWVYYTCLILLFGASLTYIFTKKTA